MSQVANPTDLFDLLSQIIEFPPNVKSFTIRAELNAIPEIDCTYDVTIHTDEGFNIDTRTKRFVLVEKDEGSE